MRIQTFLIVFSMIIVLALPTDSRAQDNQTSKIPEKVETVPDKSKSLEELSNETPSEKFASKKTNGLTVAMVFHKLTRENPDMEAWAKATSRYQDTPDHAKEGVLNDIMMDLQKQYELLNYNEPIHIETYVTLKQYDKDSNGFFVNNFKEDTFFTHKFNNEYYAVIPSDLMDYQWIKLSEELRDKLKSHMTDDNRLFMRLSLSPQRADASQKVRLPNKKSNWLISAKVLDIEFWSPKDKTLLWRSNEDFYKRKNNLLKLYQ
ncbi:MAG: hypothetical protein ACQEQL_04030 [Pseudomonadota bacterium]